MAEENPVDKTVHLMFRARNPEMALAWVQYFSDPGPWSIGVGDILIECADAIVSPANSYGFMDGGIDRAYRNFFGHGIQNRVQRVIEQRYDGKLEVGEALIVPTLKRRIPRLIVAPTMETPRDISRTNNVYLAMKAVLESVFKFNKAEQGNLDERIRTVLIPGMGTGIGRMDHFESAEQMRKAVDYVRDNHPLEYVSFLHGRD